MAVIKGHIGLSDPAETIPPHPDRAQKSKDRQQKGHRMGKGWRFWEGRAANHHEKAGITASPALAPKAKYMPWGKSR